MLAWPHRRGRASSHRRSGACCDGPTACVWRTSSPAAFARRDRHRCVLTASIYWQSESMVVEAAAAPTREHHCDDDHPSDCGQHPVGSPLAKPAAARWHFAHQRSQRAGRRAAIAPGGAPTGAPRQDVQATARRWPRCSRFWFTKNIFLQTQEVEGRRLPTAPSGGFVTNKRFHTVAD